MRFDPASQIHTIPVSILQLNTLQHAIEIKHWLSGFTKICYSIGYMKKGSSHEILKYGESTRQLDGERIYRQIWRIPGWPNLPAFRASGDDFDWVVYQRPTMTKNDVFVTIYDMRNITPTFALCPEHDTRALESFLIERHIKQHGRCPIGNRKEAKRLEQGLMVCPKKSVVDGDVYDKLFTTTN